MNALNAERLREIAALREDATPGPWSSGWGGIGHPDYPEGIGDMEYLDDGDFVAAVSALTPDDWRALADLLPSDEPGEEPSPEFTSVEQPYPANPWQDAKAQR
jgi:hypothetical protein